MATPHLPDDILLQIVQRLPLRSVLRWKRVSKQWKHLINHPLFYISYKDNSARTAFFGSLSALYCVFINDVDNKAMELIHDRNLDSPPITVHRVTIPLSNCNRFLGSSHGVACFEEKDGHFLVYNLFTGSLYTVANVPNNEEYEDLFRYYYGFGYDCYGDDYKIFVSLKGYNAREDVWIYSFTNKDWNSFQGFPYQKFSWYPKDRVAYSMNGVLHWLLINMEHMGTVIVTYDLHTNRFGELKFPPKSAAELDGIEDYWCSTVAELHGQLCYVRRTLDRRATVWVMKEYGVGDSWERLWTIECDLHYSRRMAPTNLLYKCGGGRRLVLFVCDHSFERDHSFEQRLIWYNIDENKVDRVCKEIGQETVIGQEQQKGKYDCWYFAICFLSVCITLICFIYFLAS